MCLIRDTCGFLYKCKPMWLCMFYIKTKAHILYLERLMLQLWWWCQQHTNCWRYCKVYLSVFEPRLLVFQGSLQTRPGPQFCLGAKASLGWAHLPEHHRGLSAACAQGSRRSLVHMTKAVNHFLCCLNGRKQWLLIWHFHKQTPAWGLQCIIKQTLINTNSVPNFARKNAING